MGMPEQFKGQRAPRGKQRLPNKLIDDLAEIWEQQGPQCLRRLISVDVARFCSLAYSTLPKDILVTVEQRTLPGGLDPEEWALMRRVLDLIKANVPTDSNAGPAEVFSIIEDALRARYAKPIEAA